MNSVASSGMKPARQGLGDIVGNKWCGKAGSSCFVAGTEVLLGEQFPPVVPVTAGMGPLVPFFDQEQLDRWFMPILLGTLSGLVVITGNECRGQSNGPGQKQRRSLQRKRSLSQRDRKPKVIPLEHAAESAEASNEVFEQESSRLFDHLDSSVGKHRRQGNERDRLGKHSTKLELPVGSDIERSNSNESFDVGSNLSYAFEEALSVIAKQQLESSEPTEWAPNVSSREQGNVDREISELVFRDQDVGAVDCDVGLIPTPAQLAADIESEPKSWLSILKLPNCFQKHNSNCEFRLII